MDKSNLINSCLCTNYSFISDYKKVKMASLSATDMIKILTCFILPPLAVYFDR